MYHLVFPAKYMRVVLDRAVEEVLKDVCGDRETISGTFFRDRNGQGINSMEQL